jgi:hypothetical protein
MGRLNLFRKRYSENISKFDLVKDQNHQVRLRNQSRRQEKTTLQQREMSKRMDLRKRARRRVKKRMERRTGKILKEC